MPVSFTIAIPTHDRRETALLAARSALAQTRAPEQVLVLCDGCTDGTAEALRALGDPRVEAVELPKAPGYGYEHRTRSLELARGEAILWLADDDLLLPDHLERIGELWDTGGFDLVQSHGVAVHPDESLEWFGSDWSVPADRERLATANTNPMASVSVRVASALAVGGWDASLPRAADWDLWRRMLDAGARSVRSPEPTVLHFRATGRVQPWPERVRQNTAWLGCLADPERLMDLRVRMRRLEAELDAQARVAYAELVTHADGVREHAAALQAALDAAQRELAGAHERVAALDARCAEAESTATLLAGKLTSIESGGWWRLRRRVLPLLRLVGRGQ